MPFADEYVVISAHPPLLLHSKVPRPWVLDTYSTVYTIFSSKRKVLGLSLCKLLIIHTQERPVRI